MVEALEKPILFNTEMVQAILEGRKTQTRRIIKNKYENADIEWFTNKYGTHLVYMQNDVPEPVYNPETKTTRHKLRACEEIKPPYHVGDILWVRETWSTQYDGIHDSNGYGKYVYKADGTILDNSEGISSSRWYPSIHMPRTAARIFLKVTNVRVERIQDITEEECIKEGCGKEFYSCDYGGGYLDPKDNFMVTWDSIYNNWLKNPWVWVIEFEKIEHR